MMRTPIADIVNNCPSNIVRERKRQRHSCLFLHNMDFFLSPIQGTEFQPNYISITQSKSNSCQDDSIITPTQRIVSVNRSNDLSRFMRTTPAVG